MIDLKCLNKAKPNGWRATHMGLSPLKLGFYQEAIYTLVESKKKDDFVIAKTLEESNFQPYSREPSPL